MARPLRAIAVVLVGLTAGCQGLPKWATVDTLAGGKHGDKDGPGLEAQFRWPMAVAYSRGAVFVADTRNHCIRCIDAAGRVTTFAGSHKGFADGVGKAAQFRYPRDLAADAAGNLYVADTTNRRIRKITPDGHVTTLAGSGAKGAADGPGARASFHTPWGIGVNAAGEVVVADTGNHCVRLVAKDGRVATLAGTIGKAGFADGRGPRAKFYLPRDAAFTPGGAVLVADAGNHRVREVLRDGTTFTLAGAEGFGHADGRGEVAMFGYLTGIAVDEAGMAIVVDETHHAIRRVTPEGVVSTLVGGKPGKADGPALLAQFHWPTNVAIGPGAYYVADPHNASIRTVRF